jgi:hypothetical protein
MLGISYNSNRGTLAWFDPLSLRKRPGRRAPLGGHLGSWAFSTDRARLAIAGCDGRPGGRAWIRLVNARAMRVLAEVPLGPPAGGCAGSLTWLRPDRLLTVVQSPGGSEVVVVDPAARRVLRRAGLLSWPSAAARTRDGLVLLLESFGEIAPARLAVVDLEGEVRIATVEGVLAGTIVDEDSAERRTRTVRPGLAADPDQGRAFLVPASGPVAEVDLATLAVSYHELDRPSPLRRLLDWLVPGAQAKGIVEGPERNARWLRDGTIAVSGIDWSLRVENGQTAAVGHPAGLRLIDTRSWTTRLPSPDPIDFTVASGLVIVRDEPDRRRPALVAFETDGRERWRLALRRSHDGWIDVAGRLGYVHLAEGRVNVIEVATGDVLATLSRKERRSPWPELLAEQQSDW